MATSRNGISPAASGGATSTVPVQCPSVYRALFYQGVDVTLFWNFFVGVSLKNIVNTFSILTHTQYVHEMSRM
jgi:hypothetical protein